jgi:Mrp family chromosome partitioning ATPase
LLCDPEPTDVTPAVAAMAVALASQVPGQLLVVDGTFRNTGLARLLAARPDAIEEPRPGWADVLTGKATLQQAVRGTRLPNLEMLPGRTEETAPTAPPLPEPNDRWTASLDQLRLQYQFVLIGTSPVDNPATMAIARAADAIYLLVRPGYTGQRAIRQTLRALHRCGARVLGCLLVEHSAGGC